MKAFDLRKDSGRFPHAPNSGEWLRAIGLAAVILLIVVVWTLST